MMNWESFSRGVRDLFTVNLLSKLVALVVALLLYMLTTGEKNVVTNLKLRLEVVTPEGLVIANTLPSDISFQIKGPRARINSVVDRNEVLIVPLTGARPGVSSVKIHPEMLRLPPGVEVISISPLIIEPKLEPLVTKEVDLKLVLEGEVASGYRMVKSEVRPPKIEVRGSSTQLAKITEISTIPISLSDLTQTIEKEVDVALTDNNFSIATKEPVKAYIEIEPILRGKTFKNIPVSVITRYKPTVIPKGVTVKVRGPEVMVRDFDKVKIKVEVDLSDKDPGWYRKRVTVTLPEPMTVQGVFPPSVRVQLK